MASSQLDRLGEILMTRVRDRAIGDWDKIIDGRMRGNTAEKVREELASSGRDATQVLTRMVPRVVDTVLHHLLWTLEQEPGLDLSVGVGETAGPSARDESDGLGGELYGSRGWIARFSKQRHEEC